MLPAGIRWRFLRSDSCYAKPKTCSNRYPVSRRGSPDHISAAACRSNGLDRDWVISCNSVYGASRKIKALDATACHDGPEQHAVQVEAHVQLRQREMSCRLAGELRLGECCSRPGARTACATFPLRAVDSAARGRVRYLNLSLIH